MPLQNRVTPFGEIVSTPQRGMFTGNRGIIHDPQTRTLLGKRWSGKAWLVCLCDFKGVRRQVMATRSWTELFFLDEATALAAGHRPCFFCRRQDARDFQQAWALGNATEVPSATQIDKTLHRERLQQGKKRLNVLLHTLDELPDGTMISSGGAAILIAGMKPYRWSADGYTGMENLPFIDGLLTPPAVVNALRAGYRPALHPSIRILETETTK